MNASINPNMVCSECGLNPVEIGGGAVVYTRRVRRRVLLVWLVFVFSLGVLALPWVQRAIGEWGFRHQLYVGNMYAVMDDRANIIPGDTQYRPLVEPPIRWRDLELVARGDADAAEHFRQAIEQAVEYPSNFEKAYSSYVFTVGTPRRYFNPDNGGFARAEDGEYQFTLLNKEFAYVGWPTPWVGDQTTHWYRPDPERFSESGLRSVGDDLVHVAVVDRTVRWRNVLFIVGLIVSGGYLARRACLWRQVDRWRSVAVGFVAMAVLASGVLVMGMPWRSVPGHGITGYMSSAIEGVPRSWDIEELEVSLSTDEQVRVLAQTLLEDFGEITHPDELMALGIGSSVGVGMYSLNFGYGQYGQFRLMQVAQLEIARLEDDGSYTKLPVLEEGLGWRVWASNGKFVFNRSWGQPAMVVYGGLIEYQNLFFVGIGMYVLLRVLGVVGRWWSRRVQQRRIRRGVCIWCRYPCGE